LLHEGQGSGTELHARVFHLISPYNYRHGRPLASRRPPLERRLPAYLLEQFFKENAALLPAGANPENQVARWIDEQKKTVALILDFRSCFLNVR
jgi:hypothetical protein